MFCYESFSWISQHTPAGEPNCPACPCRELHHGSRGLRVESALRQSVRSAVLFLATENCDSPVALIIWQTLPHRQRTRINMDKPWIKPGNLGGQTLTSHLKKPPRNLGPFLSPPGDAPPVWWMRFLTQICFKPSEKDCHGVPMEIAYIVVLSIYLSIYPSIYLSICLSLSFICLSV